MVVVAVPAPFCRESFLNRDAAFNVLQPALAITIRVESQQGHCDKAWLQACKVEFRQVFNHYSVACIMKSSCTTSCI
jgi:hypothetical protein